MNGRKPERYRRAAGLIASAALATSLIVPSTALGAEEYPYSNGSVTITHAQQAGINGGSAANALASYKVYQVFKAEVNDNPDAAAAASFPGVATHIKWSTEAMRNAVVGFLKSAGNGAGTTYTAWLQAKHPGYTAAQIADQEKMAQNAAEYISAMINASPGDPGMGVYTSNPQVPKTPAAQSFALELASALANAPGITSSTYTYAPTASNAAYTNTEGFYLFATDNSSVGTDEASTAPIWVPLKSTGATIAQKAAIPSVVKEVQEDSTGAFGAVADANAAQDLTYRATFSMPQNIGAFDKYYVELDDLLPAGMELKADWQTAADALDVNIVNGSTSTSIKAALLASGGANRGSIGYVASTGALTVCVDNVKNHGVAIGADTKVVLTYKAHLKSGAADNVGIGASHPNTNGLTAKYSSDPIGESNGSGVAAPPRDELTATQTSTYTYQVIVNKRDKQTFANLSGARFKVQVSMDNSDAGSKGLWLGQYGNLVAQASAYEFTTDAGGTITIPRIDEGTYIIKETTAPAGYETTPDITLAVTRTFNASGIPTLTATVTGGETQYANSTDIVTAIVGNNGAPNAGGTSVASYLGTNLTKTSSNDGIVSIITSDDRKVLMPITGMDGVTASIVYGGAAVALGLGGWMLTRRKKEASDGNAGGREE